MAIETICQGCARKLRVADEHAGGKARCPHCRTVYLVPKATGAARPGATEPTADVDPGTGPADLWFLLSEDGTEYGPVARGELDRWVGEGRVTARSQLRRKNELHWQPVLRYYPSLVETHPAGQNPFADIPPAQPVNPYEAPRAAARPRSILRPHRGGTILALGLAGIICCQIAAPFAWALGQSDLNAIRAGQMDPSGRSMTQVGMILGIAGTILLTIGFAASIFGIVID